MRAALEAKKPLALLAEIDHPDGMVRVWSRTGTLTYAGHDWDGLGILGRISPIGTSKTLSIHEVSFQLAGVPAKALEFLSANIRNRIATVWLAAIGPKRTVIPDPLQVMEARLDYQTYAVDDNGMATIALNGQVGLWTLERAVDLVWSREEIIKTYSDETGHDLIPALAQKDIIWKPS
jgi:hypothetical protein